MKSAILYFSILCSMYSFSPYFTDEYILPKWLASFAAISFLFPCVVIEFYKNRCISPPRINKVFICGLIFSCFLESVFGIKSMFGHEDEIRIGTMDNSAGFASCLCMILPYSFVYINKKTTLGFFSCFIALTIVFALLACKSRCGYLSLLSIVVIKAFYHIQSPYMSVRKILAKRRFLTLLSFVLILLIPCLFVMKKASAIGRLHIYVVAMKMIKDKPFLGHGLKAINKKYMLYQAQFFSENPESSFSLYADNVKHLFNHSLEVGVMFGIPILICLVIVCFYLIKLIPTVSGLYKQTAISSLVALIPFVLFSYPFSYPLTWLMLIVDIIILFYYKMSVLKGKSAFFVAVFCFVLVFIVPIELFKRVQMESYWRKTYDYAINHSDPNILIHYSNLSEFFADNPYFLYNYASVLILYGDYAKAKQVGEMCALIWSDYDLEILLGIAERNLNNYRKARSHFELASYMCPNRLEPLYELALVYQCSGMHKDAIHLAQKLLRKDPKIINAEAKRIKESAKKLLKEYGQD